MSRAAQCAAAYARDDADALCQKRRGVQEVSHRARDAIDEAFTWQALRESEMPPFATSHAVKVTTPAGRRSQHAGQSLIRRAVRDAVCAEESLSVRRGACTQRCFAPKARPPARAA